MNLYEIPSSLQIKPSEVRWSKQVPSNPERTENMVFLGYSPPELSYNVFPFRMSWKRWELICYSGGSELCCGVSYLQPAGRVKRIGRAREVVAELKAFSPKRVIRVCTGCYRQLMEFLPGFLDLDFEVQFYTQFLNENLGKNKLYQTCGENGNCSRVLHDPMQQSQ